MTAAARPPARFATRTIRYPGKRKTDPSPARPETSGRDLPPSRDLGWVHRSNQGDIDIMDQFEAIFRPEAARR